MSLRLRPEALRELREAVRFYDEQRPGLGLEFLNEVGRAVEFAAEIPEGGARIPYVPAEYGARQFQVRRFPYVIYVARFGDGRQVFAVAHTSRRPGYWRKRLK